MMEGGFVYLFDLGFEPPTKRSFTIKGQTGLRYRSIGSSMFKSINA